MRNTKQREIVLDVINHSCDYPTAYQIYEECRKRISNISLGTVYRNLSNLLEDGLIKKIGIDEATCRYDHVNQKHSHFICKGCGKIIDIFESYLININDIHGNIVNDYDINFSGVCSECQREDEI